MKLYPLRMIYEIFGLINLFNLKKLEDIMKFELSLKSTHQDIIQELKNKLSLESEQDIVKKSG